MTWFNINYWIVISLITAVKSIANCPLDCKCDDNTLVVECSAGDLDVLPIALNPSIQRLAIENNRIKTIDSSIQFYAELKFLDLSSNHIMTIPRGTFTYQKKLQELYLNNNKIGHISNTTFVGLSSVTIMNLRGNLISELNTETFTHLANVEELNLGENRITYIDPNAFGTLTQLQVLYLDDNALTAVPESIIFQSVPILAELYLSLNNLLVIPPKAFVGLKQLIRLDLKGANLRNISDDAFTDLENLRTLNIVDNMIKEIPTMALSHLKRLEKLSIGQNEFELIAENAFIGLKQLQRLEISGAPKLKHIMTNAFIENENLNYLDISSNKMLNNIDENAFQGLPNLQHVILKSNSLTTFSERLLSWWNLKFVDISDNAIACDCRTMWLKNYFLSRNTTVAPARCEYPAQLRGIEMKNLNPILGCSYADSSKQSLLGALLVISAATITALSLIVYRYRAKIRIYFNGQSHEDREYQKTFCDEDYVPVNCHHQYIACNNQSSYKYKSNNRDNCRNQLQQLCVPRNEYTFSNDSNTHHYIQNEINLFGRAKSNPSKAQQQLNIYSKPQFLPLKISAGDSLYSYADMPKIYPSSSSGAYHTRSIQYDPQSQPHFQNNVFYTDYTYSNTHYSLPLESVKPQEPKQPSIPPTLPSRNKKSTINEIQ